MKFAAIYPQQLRQPPVINAPPEAFHAWVWLLSAASQLESEVIPYYESMSDRELLIAYGVTQDQVHKAVEAALCEVKPTGLFVFGFDHAGLEVVQRLRGNGRFGGNPPRNGKVRGRPRVQKNPDANPEGFSGHVQPAPHAGQEKPRGFKNKTPYVPSPPLPIPSLPNKHTIAPDGARAGLTENGAPHSRPPDPDQTPPGSAAPPPRRKTLRLPATYSPVFDAFYALFPRKVAKPLAWDAWCRRDCEPNALAVMAGLRGQLPELTSRLPDKIPHPATWLNQRRWEDPPIAPAPPMARAAAGGGSGRIQAAGASGIAIVGHAEALPGTQYARGEVKI